MASSIGPKDYYPEPVPADPEVEATFLPFGPGRELSGLYDPGGCVVLIMPNGEKSLALDERYIPLINPRIKEVFEVFEKFTRPQRKDSIITADEPFKRLTNECFKEINDYYKSKTGKEIKDFYDGFLYRTAWKYFSNVEQCARVYSIIFSRVEKREITIDPKIFNEFERDKAKADLYIEAFERLKDIIISPIGTEPEMDEALEKLVQRHLSFLQVYKDYYHKADGK